MEPTQPTCGSWATPTFPADPQMQKGNLWHSSQFLFLSILCCLDLSLKAGEALNTVYGNKDKGQRRFFTKTDTGKCSRSPVFLVISESTIPCAMKHMSTAARDSDGLDPKLILEPLWTKPHHQVNVGGENILEGTGPRELCVWFPLKRFSSPGIQVPMSAEPHLNFSNRAPSYQRVRGQVTGAVRGNAFRFLWPHPERQP